MTSPYVIEAQVWNGTKPLNPHIRSLIYILSLSLVTPCLTVSLPSLSLSLLVLVSLSSVMSSVFPQNLCVAVLMICLPAV